MTDAWDRATAYFAIGDGCWSWMGARSPQGYGRFNLGSGRGAAQAHRFVYERLVGEIPGGLALDHLCRNPPCVNPDHLEPVTIGENVLRGDGKSAARARQTHCIHGHEFTPENTYRAPGAPNSRNCRACMTVRQKAELKGQAPWTHCKQGHPMTPENTYSTHGRWRTCRTCSIDRSKQRYAANKAVTRAKAKP